jgi:flagellar assembly protein FliH
MMRRLDAAAAEVLPWRIPRLDPLSEPAPEAEIPPADNGPGDLPVGTGDAGTMIEGQQTLAEIVEREAARGYADGVECGLTEGREKGYADGYAAGIEASRKSLAQDACRLAEIIAGLRAPIRALDRVVEEALVALALEVARCVIGNEISLSRNHLVRLIREALAAVPLPISGVRVLLNPQDLELVLALAPELGNGGTALLADPAVELGGCSIVVDDEPQLKERRWLERSDGSPQIDLSLAARWRGVMVSLFEGDGR